MTTPASTPSPSSEPHDRDEPHNQDEPDAPDEPRAHAEATTANPVRQGRTSAREALLWNAIIVVSFILMLIIMVWAALQIP